MARWDDMAGRVLRSAMRPFLVPVTHIPTDGQSRTLQVVFQRMSEEAAAGLGIQGERTWIEVAPDDEGSINVGDEIVVDDASYVAVGIEHDRHGLVTVMLEHSETPA